MDPAEYHKMIDAGLLMQGEPVELLEGYLVEKGMRNPPHDGSVTRVTNRLPRRLPAGWVTRVQCALSLGESEPEPDGAVMRSFNSSPVAGNGHVYVSNTDGVTFVVKAGTEFEVVATNDPGERIIASPAIAGEAMIYRTDSHLYCLGTPPKR